MFQYLLYWTRFANLNTSIFGAIFVALFIYCFILDLIVLKKEHKLSYKLYKHCNNQSVGGKLYFQPSMEMYRTVFVHVYL